jgi:hypothetical protein
MAKSRSADRQQYWREAIERQRTSGQSIVGFCSKEGLTPTSLRLPYDTVVSTSFE